MGRGLRRAVADGLSARLTSCGSVYVQEGAAGPHRGQRASSIVSRRVVTPKGDTDGGGGGADAAPATRCGRTFACWRSGWIGHDRRERPRAHVDVKLPESLHDLPHHGCRGRSQLAVRIGRQRGPDQQAADAEADVPALPRGGRQARRSARSRDQPAADGRVPAVDHHRRASIPEVLLFDGAAQQTLPIVPAGGSVEVRFDAAGRSMRPRARADDRQGWLTRLTPSRT